MTRKLAFQGRCIQPIYKRLAELEDWAETVSDWNESVNRFAYSTETWRESITRLLNNPDNTRT